jgi:hypothetical protein
MNIKTFCFPQIFLQRLTTNQSIDLMNVLPCYCIFLCNVCMFDNHINVVELHVHGFPIGLRQSTTSV